MPLHTTHRLQQAFSWLSFLVLPLNPCYRKWLAATARHDVSSYFELKSLEDGEEKEKKKRTTVAAGCLMKIAVLLQIQQLLITQPSGALVVLVGEKQHI